MRFMISRIEILPLMPAVPHEDVPQLQIPHAAPNAAKPTQTPIPVEPMLNGSRVRRNEVALFIKSLRGASVKDIINCFWHFCPKLDDIDRFVKNTKIFGVY